MCLNFIGHVLFQHLATYASENLEATNAPLFLRFLNLLMNDAIFLLDEAIQVSVVPFKLTSFNSWKHIYHFQQIFFSTLQMIKNI